MLTTKNKNHQNQNKCRVISLHTPQVSEQKNSYGAFNGKLIVSSKNGFQFIALDEIENLKADSNYTEIQLADQRRIILSKTLKTIENQLDDRFFRIHNSTIINLKYLKEINKGASTVIMDSNEQFPISRNRKKAFIERIQKETN